MADLRPIIEPGRDFGTGVISTVRHAEGTQPLLIDMLMILQTTPDSSLALFRFTPYGIQCHDTVISGRRPCHFR